MSEPGESDLMPPGAAVLQWNEIDKVKFFSVGTLLYSALTIGLHPISVLKIRQQVLNSSKESLDHLKHQQSLKDVFRNVVNTSGTRGLFRGAGIVVSLAIPARVVYITTLEETRHEFTHIFRGAATQLYSSDRVSAMMPLITSMAGGLAGGIAAMASQVLVVPMDVISQKQMIMSNEQYIKDGRVASIIRSEIQAGGFTSLFRGFGLSLFTSLPTGSVWWATYTGSQHWIDAQFIKYSSSSSYTTDSNSSSDASWMIRRVTTQVASGMSAAAVAAFLTQPLDVIRARVQVGVSGDVVGAVGGSSLTSWQVAKELAASSGARGFFRGLGPRVTHLSVWGTILSSFYEMLRHYSRKEPVM
jgi:solute carrier family 25 protein 44